MLYSVSIQVESLIIIIIYKKNEAQVDDLRSRLIRPLSRISRE